jgi:hypothetical protein
MTPTELRLLLLRTGYSPIPVQGKSPVLPGWQNKLITNPEEIELWGRIYSYASNTGALTGPMPTFDIDIFNYPEAADAIEAWVRERFKNRGEILVRIGNYPKRAIPFRTDKPFKKIFVNLIGPADPRDQVAKNAPRLEFLCDGQQIVVEGIHDDTHKPYYWSDGRGVGQVPYDQLIYITAEEAREIFEAAVTLLCSEYGFVIKPTGKNGGGAPGGDDGPTWTAIGNLIDHDELVSTAANLVRSGMAQGAAVNFLRAQVESLNGGDPERKARRLSELPGIVSSAARKLGKDGGASWEDPDWSILEDRRGELPDFPLDAFTEPWRVMIETMAYGAGVTPAHIAVPLLGVASAMVGMARRVTAGASWREPLTLWTCLVAASGDRKTPALRAVLRPLEAIEADRAAFVDGQRIAHQMQMQLAAEARKKWQSERKAALAARKKWEEERKAAPYSEPAEMPQPPPDMPPEALDPGEFVTPRLYSTDATIEKLARLLQARPRGLLQHRDELSGLFANMSRYNKGSDRPFWLEAWNGGRYVVERVSMSIVVEHLLVGIVGSFQPDKLSRAFDGDADGMYARFHFAW